MSRNALSDRAGKVGERDGEFGAGPVTANGADRGARANFGAAATSWEVPSDMVKIRGGIDQAHAAANTTTDDRTMYFRCMAILRLLAVDLEIDRGLQSRLAR